MKSSKTIMEALGECLLPKVPTLQVISTIKIGHYLCLCTPIIQGDIFERHLSSFILQLEKKVEYLISRLPLPPPIINPHLKDYAMYLLRNINEFWRKNSHQNIKFTLTERFIALYLRKLRLTVYGIINQKETILNIINDEEINEADRYRIALYFDFKEETDKLEKVCEERGLWPVDNQSLVSLLLSQNELEGLSFSRTLFSGGRVYFNYTSLAPRRDPLQREEISENNQPMTLNFKHFIQSYNKSDIERIRNFWEKLTPEEKLLGLSKITVYAERELPDEGVLIFLLSKLDSEKLGSFFRSKSADILRIFLSWPYTLNLNISRVLLNLLDGTSFVRLMLQSIPQSYESKRFFEFCFNNISEDVRNQFFSDYSDVSVILRVLCDHIYYRDFFRTLKPFLEEKMTISDCESLILSQDGLSLCETLVLKINRANDDNRAKEISFLKSHLEVFVKSMKVGQKLLNKLDSRLCGFSNFEIFWAETGRYIFSRCLTHLPESIARENKRSIDTFEENERKKIRREVEIDESQRPTQNN